MNIKKVRVSGVDYDVEDAKARGMIASDYDSTKEYEENSFVIYEDTLYRALEATTGTFDSSKWEVSDVAGMLKYISGDISADIDLTMAEYEALGDEKLTDGNNYFISDSDGFLTASNITYNNTISKLPTVTTQGAIDLLNSNVDSKIGNLQFDVVNGEIVWKERGADTWLPFSDLRRVTYRYLSGTGSTLTSEKNNDFTYDAKLALTSKDYEGSTFSISGLKKGEEYTLEFDFSTTVAAYTSTEYKWAACVTDINHTTYTADIYGLYGEDSNIVNLNKDTIPTHFSINFKATGKIMYLVFFFSWLNATGNAYINNVKTYITKYGDMSEIIESSKTFNLGNSNLYKVPITTTSDPTGAKIDLTFLSDYKNLRTEDIYLSECYGVRYETDANDGTVSYEYDPQTGIVQITSSILYYTNLMYLFVAIKPKTVIKTVATSVNGTSITYDLSSYEGYRDLTGRELFYWFPYVSRTGYDSPTNREIVSSYDKETGTLVLQRQSHKFDKNLTTAETTFFIPSASVSAQIQLLEGTSTSTSTKESCVTTDGTSVNVYFYDIEPDLPSNAIIQSVMTYSVNEGYYYNGLYYNDGSNTVRACRNYNYTRAYNEFEINEENIYVTNEHIHFPSYASEHLQSKTFGYTIAYVV